MGVVKRKSIASDASTEVTDELRAHSSDENTYLSTVLLLSIL
eukprot:CAMPEP_0114051674 /NCGR_PEP_ID=MMETSP1339-20121228/71213_1 /TAXON_ID=94617 /ORGANISM="Fibrocapsa japonica" /LENGTH=41 /assembly_acc=CAM_ASM_000762